MDIKLGINEDNKKRVVIFRGEEIIASLNFSEKDDYIIKFCRENFIKMTSISIRDYYEEWIEPRAYKVGKDEK